MNGRACTRVSGEKRKTAERFLKPIISVRTGTRWASVCLYERKLTSELGENERARKIERPVDRFLTKSTGMEGRGTDPIDFVAYSSVSRTRTDSGRTHSTTPSDDAVCKRRIRTNAVAIIFTPGHYWLQHLDTGSIS